MTVSQGKVDSVHRFPSYKLFLTIIFLLSVESLGLLSLVCPIQYSFLSQSGKQETADTQRPTLRHTRLLADKVGSGPFLFCKELF